MLDISQDGAAVAPRMNPAGQARPAESAGAQPYPLLRRFLVFGLPILGLALAGLLTAASLALSSVAERVYRADAAGRHASMAAILAVEAPGALAAIAAGRTPDGPDEARLRALLQEKADAYGLTCVGVIAPDGQSYVKEGPTCPALDKERRHDIGKTMTETLAQPGATLFKAIEDPIPAWVVATMAPSAAGSVVIATLQASSALEDAVGASTIAWVGGLGIALMVAVGVALVLVAMTQTEIDRRSAALSSARDRIARFVSHHVRSAQLGTERARRSETTVLFMDIRDFSSFAETASPDETAALVTTIAGIGFAAILAQGGDVDRLVGDGLIARFDGPDRVNRAFAAAAKILAEVEASPMARKVGIGLMDGEVVEATISVGDRADATILGRIVNLSARLCSTAQAGEIVASATMAIPARARFVDMGTEHLTLKGHRQPFPARRLRLTGQSAREGEGRLVAAMP